MTWGYRDGDSQNLVNPITPPCKTLRRLQHVCREHLAADRVPYIAPVGLAYKAIYDDIIADGGALTDQGTFYNLYSNDGSHPSTRVVICRMCDSATMTGDSSMDCQILWTRFRYPNEVATGCGFGGL